MQIKYRDGIFSYLEKPEREIYGKGNVKIDDANHDDNDGDECGISNYSLDGVEHGVISDNDTSIQNKTSSGSIKFTKLTKHSSLSALSTVLRSNDATCDSLLELNDASDDETNTNGL